MTGSISSRMLASAICAAVLASSPVVVQAQGMWSFNLPSQSLADALRAVGGQASTNVFFEPRLVAAHQAPALDGRLTVAEALTRLLQGTGLTYRYLDDNTITIVPVLAAAGESSRDTPEITPAAHGETAEETARPKIYHRFRLAQLEQTTPGEARIASNVAPAIDSDQEVVVTGSRLGRAKTEGPVPVQVYDRERIERSGQTTISDFLNTLPAVSTSTPENGGVFAGQTTIQLRGLAQGTTLVLINGRRLQNGGATAYYGGYFDLNNIPAAAVERIEIVPQGSSAVYGSDALAGVVNIILKKDFDGFQANAHYGAGSDIDDKSIDFAIGQDWGRGSLSVIGSYYERSELQSTDRAITSSPAYGPLTDRCSPGSVTSANGAALPGLSASFAAIAEGVTGRPTLGDFTAGTRNYCRQYGEGNVIPPAERASVFASGIFELTDSVELFAELMYSHNEQATWYYYPAHINRLVPASNAFNPFGVDVLVSTKLISPETKRTYDGSGEFTRPLIGARGQFAQDWKWEVAAWESRDKSEYVQTANSADPTALLAALASSNPATALNMFSDVSLGSSDLLRSIYRPAITRMRGESQVANGFVQGSLFELPAGPVEVVLGGEYVRNKLIWNGDEVTSTFAYDREATSFFSEVRVPIVGATNSQAGDKLAFTAAVRYDDYSDFGSDVTPQYALEWRPLDTLLVRGSYAEAFRAPGLVQVYAPLRYFNGGCCVNDPLNGGASVLYDQVSGGNPNLKPERGESRSLGLVWSPLSLEGLQTSLTYWELEQNDRATQNIPAQVYVDNPDLFPGRVQRDPITNQITIIDVTFINFGEVRVKGVDFDVSYRIGSGAGTFVPSLSLAEITEYKGAVLPNTPLTSRLGKADFEAWAPRRKGTLALGWSLGSYSANATARYVSSYTDFQQLGPTTRQLGDFWIYDVSGKYEIAGNGRFYDSAYVQFAVVNVMNSLPPYSAAGSGTKGYDATQYDIRGRFLSLNFGLRL